MPEKKSNKLPKYLYKYRAIDKNMISNLVNETVYFAEPMFANDPSEITFNMDFTDINLERLIDWLHNIDILGKEILDWSGNKNWREEAKILNTIDEDDKRMSLKKEDKEFILNKENEKNKKYFIEYFFTPFLKEKQRFSRIFCCAENRKIKDKSLDKNLLMWSHYADSHKGLCIEYEINDRFTLKKAEWEYLSYLNTDNSIQLNKIKYEKDLPSLWDTNGEMKHDELFFHKFSCWRYENEWRFVRQQKSFDNEKSNGNIPLKECFKCISSIIFGSESNKEDQDMIIKIFDNYPENKKPKFKIATFDRKSSFLHIGSLKEYRKIREHLYPSI